MSFIKTINQLSFGKVLSLSMVLAIMAAVPVGLVKLKQETQTSSRAAYEKPSLANSAKSTPGPIPSNPPEIGRVYPWVGKIGDIIWLQGKNFGENPISKKLIIGGSVIVDERIEAWTENQIQTTIPNDARQGGAVELSVGDHPISRSLPYVLYDKNTKTKLRRDGNIISVENAEKIAKAIIWTGDDEIDTQKHETIIVPSDGKATVFDTNGLPILSIILLDSQDKIVPYYVDPLEFGF